MALPPEAMDEALVNADQRTVALFNPMASHERLAPVGGVDSAGGSCVVGHGDAKRELGRRATLPGCSCHTPTRPEPTRPEPTHRFQHARPRLKCLPLPAVSLTR